MITRRFFVGLAAHAGAVLVAACGTRRYNSETSQNDEDATESGRSPYGTYGGGSTYGRAYGYGGWSYGGWSYGGHGYGYGGWSYGGHGYGYGGAGADNVPLEIGEARLMDTHLKAGRLALDLLGLPTPSSPGASALSSTFAEILTT